MMDYKELFLRDIPTDEHIEKTYSNRPKSKLIAYMLKESQTPRINVENRLGFNKQYFDNKLYRDSWSFDQLLAAADECGYEFCLDKALFVELAKCNTSQDSKLYDEGYHAGYEQARKDILKALGC